MKTYFGDERDETMAEASRLRVRDSLLTVLEQFLASSHAMLVIKKDRNVLTLETTVKKRIET